MSDSSHGKKSIRLDRFGQDFVVEGDSRDLYRDPFTFFTMETRRRNPSLSLCLCVSLAGTAVLPRPDVHRQHH